MTLMTSLFSGTSGLTTTSFELAVVGDNIANANTIGFKMGRAAFEDALSQSIIGGGQLGLGTRMQTIQKLITQGALTNTGLATDLALQGNGMFCLKGSHNGVDNTYFSRAGQFTIDQNGKLVNLEGLRVQGYTADAGGVVGSSLGDLALGTATAPPKPTGVVTLKANLAANDAIPALAFDPANPTTTSNFSTGVTVYDSLGNAHQTDVYFCKTAAGAWSWHALSDGGGLTGGTAGVMQEVAAGTLTYDTSGKLTDSTVDPAVMFNPLDAVNPQALTFNFGDPINGVPPGTGLGGITQFASPNATTFTAQDGLGSGSLASVEIGAQGKVVGAFTNGESRVLGQVAVGSFTSYDKLDRVGGNLFMQTPESGQPTVGSPAEGGRASITAGALEQSNVDLANEFVRMIAAQRGFQANSKTITTADQLLAELMQLKR